MRLRYKTFLLLIAFSIIVQAKDKLKYPVADIPQELLSNADAVIRMENTTFEYLAIDKATETYSVAITIFKESALSRSIFRAYYNGFSKISDIEIEVFDKDGKRVKKLDNEDIKDYSSISGGSIFDDSRTIVADPKYSTYPFTVEYSFVRKYSSTYYFPNWYLIDGFNLSVENSTFTVITPSDYKLRYLEKNLDTKALIKEENGITSYSWHVENFKAMRTEPLTPPADYWAPMVMTAPEKFSIDGVEGDFSTWQEFGQFCSHLLEDKDNIPQATVEHVKGLLNDSMTDYEKVSTIHHYAQQKNRYISIQDGLNGLQPFDAETVDRLSYGDCKALTNYTMSLLKALNYDCFYTLVEAGHPSIVYPEFPMHYFNHVFLCVPVQKDTIWVECTDSYSPCGSKSDFTDDRYVLIVDNDNSKLVKTPSFKCAENQQRICGEVNIGENGDALGNYSFLYEGAQFSNQLGLTLLDEADRKKKITQSINAPNFDLESYELKVDDSRKPTLEKDLQLYLFNYCSKMGDKMILKVNTINNQSFIPPYARGRKTPLYIQRNYSENDSIQFVLHESMAIDALPDPISIESEFGQYKSNTTIENGTIKYTRYMELKKGIYPKEKYNDFREFLEKIAKADDACAVIKTKDT